MRCWLNTIWPPYEGECHDFSSIWAQNHSKKAIDLLKPEDYILIYETKTGPKNEYFTWFCWDEVPGKSSGRFINFLKSNFYINFSEYTNIKKSDDTIHISDGKIAIWVRLITKELQENWYEAILLTSNGKMTSLFGEIEEGKMYIKSENNKERIEGRFGIIALLKSNSEFKEHHWEGPEPYKDRDPIDWKWEAKTKIASEGGFVPQSVVCEIMEYPEDFYFRGWGIKEISETNFLRLLEYYANHPI